MSSRNIESFFQRVDGRDRALFVRVALGSRSRTPVRRAWVAVTHLGGATASILAALAPLFVGEVASVGTRALMILVLSHCVVQMVKRTVGRRRPSMDMMELASISDPDKFSFPSGHSAASMSVAMAYAVAFPHLAIPLVAFAMVVGMSRVYLGAHFPGDVLMGQALALLTGAAVIVFS